MAASPTTIAALWALARHHLRRAWGASVAIAVFAGLVAAVPMALLSTARYGDQAFDRFVTWSDPPELVVNVCPPGVDPEVDGVDPCVLGVDLEDDARRIAGLEHVRSATVGGFVFGQGGPDPDPATWGPPVSGYAATGDVLTAGGRPIVIEGRVADRDAADEITLTEQGAKQFGIGVGDEFHLAAPGSDDVASATVVGVLRIVDHLLPIDDPTSAVFHVREGWLDANGDKVVNFAAIIVQVEDGRADDVADALPSAFDGQVVNTEPFLPADQRRISNQALDFEAGALLALAAASAVAAAALVAQVVSRRNRSELKQVTTLRAIGATERFLAGSVLLRWLPVAAGAVSVAILATVLAPVLGPFGVARRAPWSAGPRVEWLVIVAGAVLLPLLVLGPALLTVRRRPVGQSQLVRTPARGLLSKVTRTFLRQSLERRSVGSMATAVVVSGAALAVLMGAVTVTANLERVVSEPERYGAPYDALVPGAVVEPTELAELEGLEGAAVFIGTDVRIAGESVWVQALQPLEDLPMVPPVIFEGRAPTSDDEVALAPITLGEAGRKVGDSIEIPDADGELVQFRIVGVAPITDGYEHNVGLGGLFTADGLARLDPVATSNVGDIGLRVDPDRRAAALAELQAAHPEAFVPFPVPSTLGNARRITGLPVLLAIGGAGVAAATFAHALLVATRHRQRDLAVLRVLGMVRRQSFGVVSGMAVALAVIVAVGGGVAGLVLGRWGWGLVSDSFGVAPSVAYPVLALVTAPTVAVLIALAVSSWPARRASNVRPGHALRAD